MALQVPPNCDLTLGLICLDKSVPGHTVWQMRADERFLNPAGIVQGGFLSAMLDSAMGASAVSALEGRKAFVSNAELKVSFLRPGREGEVLTCTATVSSRGRTVMFLEGTVVNDEATEVARATSTYIVKER